MAPKKASAGTAKRSAEAAPGEEMASKRLATTLKKHTVSQSLYKSIAEIIGHPLAKNISQDTREMLLAGLPHSLCVPSDERQEFQQATVQMIGQLMRQIVAAMQTSLDCEHEKVTDAETKRKDLEDKCQASEAALKDAQAMTAARQSELEIAYATLQSMQAELTKAKEAQKAGDAAHVSAAADKEALETALMGNFEKIRLGTEGYAAQGNLYQQLKPLLFKLELDTSLVSAMESALLKMPETRGRFDVKVVEAIEGSFATRIKQLTDIIVEGQPASESRAAAVTQARCNVTEAETIQKVASDALATAKDAQKEAQAMLKVTRVSLAEYMPEHKKATDACNQQRHRLQQFMDRNVASFNTLDAKITASKKKELAAEAKVAAMAAAQAAAAAAAASAAEAAKASTAGAETSQELAAKPHIKTAAIEEAEAGGGAAVKTTAESATDAIGDKSSDDAVKHVEPPVSLEAAAQLGA